MNDRELLELAAKAAGIELVWGGPDKDMSRRTDTWMNWNPLTDDGDALRLMVKLRLTIDMVDGSIWHKGKCVAGMAAEGNQYIITRHAIVRAAAEIGKAMK